MVSLSPCYRSQLYECVTNVLRAALNDECGASPGKTAETSLDLIVAVVAAVQSIVSDACADFKEKWNFSKPNSLVRLPVEILVDCFRFLKNRGRFTVSHVSRECRRVALADKQLWADFDNPDNVEKLAALLSRSHPVPFSLSWTFIKSSANEFTAAMELVARNMGRMELLSIKGVRVAALHNIFDHPAPLLRNLTLDFADGAIELPGLWGARKAPRLQSLTVEIFSVPRDFAPLATVREFRGYLPVSGRTIGIEEVGLHHLFRIFPGLSRLCLSNVTARSLSLLPPLPGSIVDVEFSSAPGQALDFSAYVESCPEHTARRFRASLADKLPATIDAFARKAGGAWGMKFLAGRGWIQLEEENRDSTAVYSVTPGDSYWYNARQHPFMRCLDWLSSLTLPMRTMLDFASAYETVWDRQLPSLRTLAATADSRDDVYAARYHVARRGSAAPLHCLQLERVLFTFSPECDVDEFVGATLPALMPLLVEHDYSQPLDVLLVCRSATQLRDRGVQALSHIARHVQVREEPSDVLLAEFVDGEPLRGLQADSDVNVV